MFSSPTTYRSRAGTIKVLPGASHSDAWVYVTTGRPLPERPPSSHASVAGRVRRHGSSRERGRRRGALTELA
jgi:hypothetical protein